MKLKTIIYDGECGEGLERKSKLESIVRKTEKIIFVFKMVLLYGRNSLIMNS
jgi:hypothetical protein